MDKRSKIYLAGHTGLVGSAIMRKLKSSGYDNLVFFDISELDLRRQEQVEGLFEKERPDYVIIAAAKVGGILANSTYKAEFIYDNIMIAANIIQASYKFGVKKLLNLGSSCIYPKLAPQPMREKDLLTGALEGTNEPYAIAKIAAIKMCRYFNEQYGTNFISVMPTNQYGPNDNFNLETGHVLPAMIRKFHLAKLLEAGDLGQISLDISGHPFGYGISGRMDAKDQGPILDALKTAGISKGKLTLWGSGEPYREFLHSEDLAGACIYLMENRDFKDIGELVNIGSGEDLKLRELSRIIQEVVGFKGEVAWDRSKPDGTPRKLLDVSRIKSLGWAPEISLKDGIVRTYGEYQQSIREKAAKNG